MRQSTLPSLWWEKPETSEVPISEKWTAAEAALPLGWQISGLYRFDGLWVALSEGPAADDYLSGSGRYAEQALRRTRR